MEIFLAILLLIVGMILLIKGADFFVEGASQVAKALKVPSLIIGLTLVSIGTSLPETSVSVASAISNNSDLSFGNVVGSNIFNVLVVIGLCSTILPMVVSKSIIKFDIPIYFAIMIIIAIFAYGISPFVLERWEAGILFAIFIGYLAFTIYRGIKHPDQDSEENAEYKRKPMWLNLILIVVGLVGIIFGGDLVVDNAAKLATKLGMSQLLVGLTIVAVGTSLPELVTSLVACKKGENDIAVGNAIGSCLFNIVGIISISGMIREINLTDNSYIDFIVMAIAAILVFLFAFKTYRVNRWQGIVMVLLYVCYLTFIIIRN